jgi:hypothetical protein
MASSDSSPPVDPSSESEPAVRPLEALLQIFGDGATKDAQVSGHRASPGLPDETASTDASAAEAGAAEQPEAVEGEASPAPIAAEIEGPKPPTVEASAEPTPAAPAPAEAAPVEAEKALTEPAADAAAPAPVPPALDAPAEAVKRPLPPLFAAKAESISDDDVDAEWELTGDLFSVPESERPEVVSAPPPAAALIDRPWRDVDDLDDDDDEATSALADEATSALDDLDDDDATSVVANEKPDDETLTGAKPAGDRPWKDVDDLEDDDDPSEYLPTRVFGVPAPSAASVAAAASLAASTGQRTLVPPPPSRSALSRSPASLSLPAIPPPPTLPRSVAPLSIPPVAFDWIREHASKRGPLALVLGGLLLLVVGVLPIIAFGSFVAGLFGKDGGTLVVTVAGPNHGPIDAPLVVADEVLRCKASPCRIEDLSHGTHFVRVSAPGYQEMAPRAVSIEEGGESALHIELMRVPAAEKVAAAPAQPLDLDDPNVKAESLPRQPAAAAVPARVAAPAAELTRTSGVAPSGPASTEKGTLNLSSNPPSNVVLDGKPLGTTPRAGIKVKPGKHHVVFIHPKLGRKSARANVKPGATSNVSVRFR